MNSYAVYAALALLRPREVIGLRKRRMGDNSGGGFVVFDDMENTGPVYQFGPCMNIAFELDLAELGKQVHIFDKDIQGPIIPHQNFNFRRQKLASVTDRDQALISLPDVLEDLGHVTRSDLFLKIDMEGDEWGILPSLTSETLLKFRQILIEVHWLQQLGNTEWRASMHNAFTLLRQHFVLGHVHSNNHASLSVVEGFVVPQVLRMTFIRRDLACTNENATLYPMQLDYSCDSRHPDHLLWFYPFLPVSLPASPDPYRASLQWSNRGAGDRKSEAVRQQLMLQIAAHESQLAQFRAALTDIDSHIDQFPAR